MGGGGIDAMSMDWGGVHGCVQQLARYKVTPNVAPFFLTRTKTSQPSSSSHTSQRS
jgi:hypothetical protein